MSTKSILDIYGVVETGQPVLAGHVMKKIFDKYGSQRKIEEWATLENEKNGFPPVTLSRIKKFYTMYNKRHQRLHNFQRLKEECKKVAHSPSAYVTSSSTPTVTETTSPADTTSSIPIASSTTLATPVVSDTTLSTPTISDTTSSTPIDPITNSSTPTTLTTISSISQAPLPP